MHRMKFKMHLKTAIIALSFLSSAAYPLLESSGTHSSDRLWEHLVQKANLVAEETQKGEITKGIEALKSHLAHKDLHRQDLSLGQKLSEGHKLGSDLILQLSELGESLSSSAGQTQRGARGHLVPLARRFQGRLRNSLQDLCSHLSHHAGQLEAPQVLISPQEAVQHIGQVLDSGIQRLLLHLEKFQKLTSRAADEFADAGLGEHWQGAVEGLGQEAGVLREVLQGRAAALHDSLALPPSSELIPDKQVMQQVGHFCHSSSLQNRLFGARVEHHLEGLQQGWPEGQGKEQTPDHSSANTLGENFSAKLNALLLDIRRALD